MVEFGRETSGSRSETCLRYLSYGKDRLDHDISGTDILSSSLVIEQSTQVFLSFLIQLPNRSPANSDHGSSTRLHAPFRCASSLIAVTDSIPFHLLLANIFGRNLLPCFYYVINIES